ncbi:MAG: protein-L-isoaspartate(D-aspartate) O-methyltransferase [Pseudomonadota bacterium]
MTDQSDTNKRIQLLEEIAAEVSAMSVDLGRESLSPNVMAAIADVPRHQFVLLDDRDRAWENTSLDIACGQRISQPLTVAIMTEMLGVSLSDRVLEIGTGCGYQAAILSELVADVYSVEVLDQLAQEAEIRLGRLGIDNVHVRHGDGLDGWAEAAPFDAIIFTAALPEIPARIFDQLKPGGRLVAPIGEVGPGIWDDLAGQTLFLFEKDEEGHIERTPLLGVRFVPVIDAGRLRNLKRRLM